MADDAGSKSGMPGWSGRAGADGNFAELMQSNAGWVHAAAGRRLRDSALADDAVQAVFLALWSKYREPPEGGHHLRGWLANTTRYICNNMRVLERRRAARGRRAAGEQSERLRLGADHTESEQLAALDAAMRRLPAGDRDILVARFYQGRSIRELASLLGLTEPAAKMRLSRAIKRLRTEMASQNHPEDRRISAPQTLAGWGIASLLMTAKALKAAMAKSAAPPRFRCTSFSGRRPRPRPSAAALEAIPALAIAVAVLLALLPSARREGPSDALPPISWVASPITRVPPSVAAAAPAWLAHTNSQHRTGGRPHRLAAVLVIPSHRTRATASGFQRVATGRETGILDGPNPVPLRESTGAKVPT